MRKFGVICKQAQGLWKRFSRENAILTLQHAAEIISTNHISHHNTEIGSSELLSAHRKKLSARPAGAFWAASGYSEVPDGHQPQEHKGRVVPNGPAPRRDGPLPSQWGQLCPVSSTTPDAEA